MAALLIALAFAAASCGGDDDEGEAGGTTTAEEQAPTAIAGLGTTLDEIKEMARAEGKVNLIIWAGYADKSWADDVREDHGLQREHEGRRELGRHDRPDLERRVRRGLGLGQCDASA